MTVGFLSYLLITVTARSLYLITKGFELMKTGGQAIRVWDTP